MDLEALKAANKNPSPSPMSEDELDALRVPKWRDSPDELLPLPPGIRLILSIDRDFRTWKEPMFAEALSGDNGVLKSTTGTAWMRDVSMLGQFMIEVEGDVWHDTKMPALIPIYSPGDQGVFLYIGESDEDGCFPIFRYDDEPCGWISCANLADHILGDEESRTEAAKGRNAHFTDKEWWADTPAMQEFWSLMEGS